MTLYSPQIVQTLADQVHNLTPLRDSFRRLEQYYLQLTTDFNELLSESELSQKQLMANLRYLEEIHRSLDREFSECTQDLRQLNNQTARMQMENNQLLAQSQALKSRELLQTEQKAALEEKRQELLEQNGKLTFSISKFKEMIHNIQLTIKGKQYENMDIQKQIKKLEIVNEKINQFNKDVEENIDSLHSKNEEAVQQIYGLEEKLQTYDKLIDAKERQNKESIQLLISKTQELEQLKHRKEYLDKMIEAESSQQRQMSKNQAELESILSAKHQKLMFVEQENLEFQKIIQEEKEKHLNHGEQLTQLKMYLQLLISTNEELFRELEKSCAQDREVQVRLSDKLQRLLIMNQEVVQNDIQNRPQLIKAEANPKIFRQKNISPSKVFYETHSKIVNRQTSPQGSFIDKLKFTKTQQFGSTWSSKCKQNLIQ